MIAHAYSPGVNLGQLATRIWPGGGAPTAVVSTFGSPAASTVSIGAARIGVPTISGPAMTASPISRPAISPPLPATTVVPAGIATFEANGSDDKDKTWVKATFSRSTGIPPGLRRVRNEGVRQESDIDLALTYISILDERFGRIVDVIKERRDDGSLKINIDEGKDQNASALISFKGRLNRDSEEYGEVITLGRNSTPDTLLHEIMHAIPFSMVRELFTHMDLPATPNVRHDASFFEIKRDILKNSRAHEIFSFGSECLMYDIERERGITHTFNSKMMSDIYGSWRIAGLAGVRTTFPYFMPHYERREGLMSLLTASVIKLKESSDMSWEEFQKELDDADGDKMSDKIANLAQRNLMAYARAKKLVLPEGFFEIKRGLDFSRGVAGVREQFAGPFKVLAQRIQAKYDAIDKMEGLAKDDEPLAPIPTAELSSKQIPPAETHDDRKKLFAAYMRAVDSTLDDPPGMPSRNEIASLISFVRMTPPHIAKDLAKRIRIYIDDDMNDLGVLLGLILVEKGVAYGEKLVGEFLDINTLDDAMPAIVRVMGSKPIHDYVEKAYADFQETRRELVEPIRIWALDQIIFEDSGEDEIETAVGRILETPELMGEQGFATLGSWLIDYTDVDYDVDEGDFMRLRAAPSSELARKLGTVRMRYSHLLSAIDAASKAESLDDNTEGLLQRIRGELSERRSHFLANLSPIISRGTPSSDVSKWGSAADFTIFYEREELDEFLGTLDPNFAVQIRIDFENDLSEWWSDPNAIHGRMSELLDKVSTEEDNDTAHAAVSELFDIIQSSISKFDNLEESPQDNLASDLPRLISEYRRRLGIFIAHRKAHSSGDELMDITVKFENFAVIDLEFVDSHAVQPRAEAYGTQLDPGLSYHEEFDDADLKWKTLTLHVDPSRISDEDLEQLRTSLDEILEIDRSKRAEDGNQDDKTDITIAHNILPYLAFQFSLAIEQGRVELATRIRNFVTEEIPKRIPPKSKYMRLIPDRDDANAFETTWSESLTYQTLNSIQWGMDLSLGRLEALQSGEMNSWFSRVRNEINRGGRNISLDLLYTFLDAFEKEGDQEHIKEILRLITLKTLSSIGGTGGGTGTEEAARIRQTTHVIERLAERIHKSPLSEPDRDILLYEFFERLFKLASYLGGVNLKIISRLEGLFPWRTPFMSAGDPPNYERTEALVLKSLASVDELTDPNTRKDLRLRLAAFAAAGLPLQRYHEWLEEIVGAATSKTEQSHSATSKQYLRTVESVGIPHPYDIPASLDSDDVDDFLTSHGEKLSKIMANGDELQFAVATSVLSRVIGGELREDYDSTRAPKDIMDAKSIAYTMGWIEEYADNPQMRTRVQQVYEILMSSGPEVIRRLNIALRLFQEVTSPEIKRHIFDKATERLIYGNVVRSRVATLRGGDDEEGEMEFYDHLLSIHYDKHRGGMPSNLFISKFTEDADLRSEYAQYVSTAGVEGADPVDPLLVAELDVGRGLDDSPIEYLQWRSSNVTARINHLYHAVRFLRAALSTCGYTALSMTDEYGLRFTPKPIMDNIEQLQPYIDPLDQGLRRLGIIFEGAEFSALHIIDEVQIALSAANYHVRIAEILDEIFHESGTYSFYDDDTDSGDLDGWLEAQEERLRVASTEYYNAQMDAMRSDPDLPEFIRSRSGFEQNVLMWVYGALNSSTQNVLRHSLGDLTTDEDRLLEFGRTAHLEKLLQLASIHPAVPENLQRMFSVFQEDVPSRDEIDAQRTIDLELTVDDRARLEIDLESPIKEGTIGGVYRGKYAGEDRVFKLQPNGKNEDLIESLRIVAAVREGISASGYEGRGARALDDFLAFYERTMLDEMDLTKELTAAYAFADFVATNPDLQAQFVVPKYKDEPSSIMMLAMQPIYSRRLGELSPDERSEVFRRIDDTLIPTMMMGGIIHYDLHPGNIGILDDGRIVLYDMGRIHVLKDSEQTTMLDFYLAIGVHDRTATIEELRKMGTVWNAELFENIGELLEPLFTSDDPFDTIEQIYPRFSDYGFRLDDSYVKLLLMFLTWNGTKKSLENGSSVSE